MDNPINPLTVQRQRRATLLITAAVMLALAAGAFALNRLLHPSVSASDIRVAEVRRGDISNAISASGLVLPMHEEQVPSPIQSRVAKVVAKPGQKVAAGELLLELDDHAIRLALDSVREQLAQQENRVGALSLDLEQKHKQIASAIELLELDLKSARVKRERYTTLRQAGGVSGEDMLAAELNVTRFEIQLRQQRALVVDIRRSTNSSIDGARVQTSILQKQLPRQQELLDRTRVRAPFAGVLTMLLEEEGASVMLGQQLARVSDLANYRVEATLSDFHARSLSSGQAVRIEQGNQILAGRVQTVLPEIKDGSVRLLVSLEQPNHPSLRNKMRVDVNIITDHRKDVLVSDNGPAFNGKGRQPVYVIMNGVAHKKMLDMGSSDGKLVEIVSGAQPRERLIVSDTSTFREHDSISIRN